MGVSRFIIQYRMHPDLISVPNTQLRSCTRPGTSPAVAVNCFILSRARYRGGLKSILYGRGLLHDLYVLQHCGLAIFGRFFVDYVGESSTANRASFQGGNITCSVSSLEVETKSPTLETLIEHTHVRSLGSRWYRPTSKPLS